MHELLNDNWVYHRETQDEFSLRYSGFGAELYRRMAVALPDCYRALQLFRSVNHQTEDAFAVCEIAHPFVVQLDPECKVICLWDSDTHIEIGTWSSDPCEEAFVFIRNHFISH